MLLRWNLFRFPLGLASEVLWLFPAWSWNGSLERLRGRHRVHTRSDRLRLSWKWHGLKDCYRRNTVPSATWSTLHNSCKALAAVIEAVRVAASVTTLAELRSRRDPRSSESPVQLFGRGRQPDRKIGFRCNSRRQNRKLV